MNLVLIILLISIFAIIIYSIGSFFIVYHLNRFGVGVLPKKISLIFMVGSFVLVFAFAVTILPTIIFTYQISKNDILDVRENFLKINKSNTE